MSKASDMFEAAEKSAAHLGTLVAAIPSSQRRKLMDSFEFVMKFLENVKEQNDPAHEAPTQVMEVPKDGNPVKRAKA